MSSTRALNANPEMSLDDVQRLYRLQSDFERNPQNMQTAYDLFTELNRLGKFNTVMRLYDKYELAFISHKEPYAERMQAQYEYARDNIGSLGLNMADLGAAGDQKMNSQNLNKILFSKYKSRVMFCRWGTGLVFPDTHTGGVRPGDHDDIQEFRSEEPTG